jgi:hypothetical protein
MSITLRLAALLSLSLLASPAMAERAADMKPALVINYTHKNIEAEQTIKTLINEVRKIDPHARYDVVGYETTPKNDFWPVSTRVKQVRQTLIDYGVAPERTYVLVKPTTSQYQRIEIYVHN